jgi:putative ABC transport system permease protein
VGLTLTAIIARAAGGLLFGVDPTDKVTYLAVAGLLAMISLAASYVPARRASRADPMVILRQD